MRTTYLTQWLKKAVIARFETENLRSLDPEPSTTYNAVTYSLRRAIVNRIGLEPEEAGP